MKIQGVIVLYNPEKDVLINIQSYINEIDKLYVVDNSENKNFEFIEKIQDINKCIYIDNNGNQGIAHALNVGAKLAIENGADWLLTMDQDSKASPTMLSTMIECMQNKETSKIGIISPYHANKFYPISKQTQPCSEILVTMTSGNLLNLNVFTTIGPFMEKLFIDHVDTEYCLRLQKYGFLILQANQAILHHNVGDLKLHKLLFKTFFSTNHTPIRKYYVYRNGSILLDLYEKDLPEYLKKLRARYFIDAFIVLFYEKQKFTKLKMMFRGYMDYKRNIFGKYND